MIGIYIYKMIGFFKSQWTRFRPMPFFLKLITFFCLISVLFLVVTVVPIDGMTYTVNGVDYTYKELWSSGAGPIVSTLGIILPLCGIGFIYKKVFSKYVFVGLFVCLLSISSILSIVQEGDWTGIVYGMMFISVLAWYLFFSKRVVAYYSDLKG